MIKPEEKKSATGFVNISTPPDDVVGAIFDDRMFTFGKFLLKIDNDNRKVYLSNDENSYVASMDLITIDGAAPIPRSANSIAFLLRKFINTSLNIDAGGDGGITEVKWGDITGAITNQNDLEECFVNLREEDSRLKDEDLRLDAVKANKIPLTTIPTGNDEYANTIVIEFTEAGMPYIRDILAMDPFLSVLKRGSTVHVIRHFVGSSTNTLDYLISTGGYVELWKALPSNFSSWGNDFTYTNNGVVFQWTKNTRRIRIYDTNGTNDICLNGGTSTLIANLLANNTYISLISYQDLSDVSNAGYVYDQYLDHSDFELDSASGRIKTIASEDNINVAHKLGLGCIIPYWDGQSEYILDDGTAPDKKYLFIELDHESATTTGLFDMAYDHLIFSGQYYMKFLTIYRYVNGGTYMPLEVGIRFYSPTEAGYDAHAGVEIKYPVGMIQFITTIYEIYQHATFDWTGNAMNLGRYNPSTSTYPTEVRTGLALPRIPTVTIRNPGISIVNINDNATTGSNIVMNPDLDGWWQSWCKSFFHTFYTDIRPGWSEFKDINEIFDANYIWSNLLDTSKFGVINGKITLI